MYLGWGAGGSYWVKCFAKTYGGHTYNPSDRKAEIGSSLGFDGLVKTVSSNSVRNLVSKKQGRDQLRKTLTSISDLHMPFHIYKPKPNTHMHAHNFSSILSLILPPKTVRDVLYSPENPPTSEQDSH